MVIEDSVDCSPINQGTTITRNYYDKLEQILYVDFLQGHRTDNAAKKPIFNGTSVTYYFKRWENSYGYYTIYQYVIIVGIKK